MDCNTRHIPPCGGIIIAIILSIGFWICIGLGIWLYIERAEDTDIKKVQTNNHIADNNTVNRMKYHGIWPNGPFPTCDKVTGICTFKRNGKEIKL
jgi:hypothetical protein